MPKSTVSYHSLASDYDQDEEDVIHEEEIEAVRNAHINSAGLHTAPASPVHTRRHTSARASELNLRGRLPLRTALDETTGLLTSDVSSPRNYRTLPASTPGTPIYAGLRRNVSNVGSLRTRHHSRRESFGLRLARALGTEANQAVPNTPFTAKSVLAHDDRVWVSP